MGTATPALLILPRFCSSHGASASSPASDGSAPATPANLPIEPKPFEVFNGSMSRFDRANGRMGRAVSLLGVRGHGLPKRGPAVGSDGRHEAQATPTHAPTGDERGQGSLAHEAPTAPAVFRSPEFGHGPLPSQSLWHGRRPSSELYDRSGARSPRGNWGDRN